MPAAVPIVGPGEHNHGPDAIKGKTPATENNIPSDESDDGESEEDDNDNTGIEAEEEEADEDDLAEIDTDNIVTGGRTRGKNIDFAKAAESLKAEGEDDSEDEEDDEEFVDPDSKMQE